MSTRNANELSRILSRIDERGYKAYKEIAGAWSMPPFTLFIDHVQGDPYAAPSRMRLRLDADDAAFPPETISTPTRTAACEDLVARVARGDASRRSRNVGTGGGGLIHVDAGGQEILNRTAARVTGEYAELRLSVGLPARGRRIMGRAAAGLLTEAVPAAGEVSLFHSRLPSGDLASHINTAEDHQRLAALLPEMRLVAFVADGSVLPRKSGISDEPLAASGAVPFRSPEELRLEVELPHRGRVSGMGVREGVTLIAGGGFHGKSTLLQALSLGIYPHIPGDGRELVASRPDTVKVCAEDGRRVERVNISAFISNLPGGIDTTGFSTENASGSTSQASYIIEAVEMGAGAFLIDEDISATNFLIRDARMQRLIAKEKEPITPYIDMVRPLYEDHGISTVLVLGGSGDYFDVADTVIAMDEFIPFDVTADAHRVAVEIPAPRLEEGEPLRLEIVGRRPDPRSLDPRKGGKSVIKARGLGEIQYGRTDIELSALMQLNDRSQTRAICGYLRLLPRELSSSRELKDAIEEISARIQRDGLEALSPYPGEHPGDLAQVRGFEVAGAVNRLRTLRVLDR